LDQENPSAGIISMFNVTSPVYEMRAFAYFSAGSFDKAREDLDLFDKTACAPYVGGRGCGPPIDKLPGKANEAAELRGDIEMKMGEYARAKQYYAALLSEQKKLKQVAIQRAGLGVDGWKKRLDVVEQSIVGLEQKFASAEHMLTQPPGTPPPPTKPPQLLR
jgi:tetratricopeptide (TPR) repeat protein